MDLRTILTVACLDCYTYLCLRISRSDTRNDIRKDLTPPSDLKNPTGSYIVGFFFFCRPKRTNCGQGQRRRIDRGESLDLIRLPTENDHLAYVVITNLSKDSPVTRLGGLLAREGVQVTTRAGGQSRKPPNPEGTPPQGRRITDTPAKGHIQNRQAQQTRQRLKGLL